MDNALKIDARLIGPLYPKLKDNELEEVIRKIKELRSYSEIGREHGVNRSTIYRIAKENLSAKELRELSLKKKIKIDNYDHSRKSKEVR